MSTLSVYVEGFDLLHLRLLLLLRVGHLWLLIYARHIRLQSRCGKSFALAGAGSGTLAAALPDPARNIRLQSRCLPTRIPFMWEKFRPSRVWIKNPSRCA